MTGGNREPIPTVLNSELEQDDLCDLVFRGFLLIEGLMTGT